MAPSWGRDSVNSGIAPGCGKVFQILYSTDLEAVDLTRVVSLNGLNSGSPSCRAPTRYHSDEPEQDSGGHECERVSRFEPIKERGLESSESESCEKAAADPGQGKDCGFSKYHAKYLICSGPKRHPGPNPIDSARHRGRHHTINAETGQ